MPISISIRMAFTFGVLFGMTLNEGLHNFSSTRALFQSTVSVLTHEEDDSGSSTSQSTSTDSVVSNDEYTNKIEKSAGSSGRSYDQQMQQRQHFLEDLLYKYGSDKSHDDHSYGDAYGMLWDPIRLDVQNVTELGIMAGQSLQAWYHYFPNAIIHGYDVKTLPSVPKIVQQLADRVRFSKRDLLAIKNPADLAERAGLYPETMDIIIEDALHSPSQQEALLNHLWHLLKPGGYYIIEDINPHKTSQHEQWVLHPERLGAATRDILENQGDAVFVNTAVGHRAWDMWVNRTSPTKAAINRELHNSHLLVIRKRIKPLPEQVQMNLRDRAMTPDGVVLD